MVKVIFLDRDGTINVDTGCVYLVEHWQFLRNAVEGLRLLQDAGYALAIVTNQRKIGEGVCTESQVQELHKWLQDFLEQQGIHVVITYCPHRIEENCDCRKPKTGLAKQVEKQLGEIDYAHSWMIGDKSSDILFGKGIGARTILLPGNVDLEPMTDYYLASLYDAAVYITAYLLPYRPALSG